MGKFTEVLGIWRGEISLTDPPPRLDVYEKKTRKIVKTALFLAFGIWACATAWWFAQFPPGDALEASFTVFAVLVLILFFSVGRLHENAPQKCDREQQGVIIELSQTNSAVDAYRLMVVRSGREFYKEDLAAIVKYLDEQQRMAEIGTLMAEESLFRAGKTTA